MAVIRVPKTPMSAYDTKRRASDLLRSQIQHLKWAIADPPQRKVKLKPPMVTGRLSEGEAAKQITRLSRRLQKMAMARYEASLAAPADAPAAATQALTKRAPTKRTVKKRTLKKRTRKKAAPKVAARKKPSSKKGIASRKKAPGPRSPRSR